MGVQMSFDEMYQAVIANDASYDGVFFYAVKSTGIYCKPSCKSRIPKAENVSFYQSFEDAQQDGYRPCKRCRSDLVEYRPMKEIALQLKVQMDALFQKQGIVQIETGAFGLSSKRIVEIFKGEYGITPNEYMSNLRYEEAIRRLQNSNDKIVDIAYAIGFSSISAFYAFFKKRASMSPATYRKGVKR